MNFLAHLFLSCSDESLLIGNFLTDFLNKPETEKLPGPYHQGVRFHRFIDSFTDQHPSVQAGVKILRPYHGKYASVVIDVYYDYFLIQNWSRFTDESFIKFRKRVYKTIMDHLENMPQQLKPGVIRMIEGDWLASYGTEEGILYAIDRLSKRASRPAWLIRAAESFQKEKTNLNLSFLSFFPDLIEQTQKFCQ